MTATKILHILVGWTIVSLVLGAILARFFHVAKRGEREEG